MIVLGGGGAETARELVSVIRDATIGEHPFGLISIYFMLLFI